jgi:DNA-directed RNA polymerase specialized sigma subunit
MRTSSAPSFATLADTITELPDRERKILAVLYQEKLTLAEIGGDRGRGVAGVAAARAIARLRTSLAAVIQKRGR